MRKPKEYFVRINQMSIMLKQMRLDLNVMHNEIKRKYESMPDSRKETEFGDELEELVEYLSDACDSCLGEVIDYVDSAALNIKGLPMADGYSKDSELCLAEYEEMKELDKQTKEKGDKLDALYLEMLNAEIERLKAELGRKDGGGASYNSGIKDEVAKKTDDDGGSSGNIDNSLASLAGLAGAYLGWKLGSRDNNDKEERPGATTNYYEGYTTDDPEWRDEDNDGFDDRDEYNDGFDDRDGEEWGYDDFDGEFDDDDYDNNDYDDGSDEL